MPTFAGANIRVGDGATLLTTPPSFSISALFTLLAQIASVIANSRAVLRGFAGV